MKTKQSGEAILVILLILASLGGFAQKTFEQRCTYNQDTPSCQQAADKRRARL